MGSITARRRRIGIGAVLVLALTALVLGYRGLQAPRSALATIRGTTVEGIPVTTWTPHQPRGPVVIVMHGFAGSQQVMQPYALTLARAGFATLTVDLPGHGANHRPLPSTDDRPARTRQLEATLDAVVRYARRIGDGRVALVGHSRGADAAIWFAHRRSGIAAVVALAPGDDLLTHGNRARNLLVLTGALDAAARPVAERIADQAADDNLAHPGRTYGSLDSGTARKVVILDGVEHVGILFSSAALARSRDWLSESFPVQGISAQAVPPQAGEPFVDRRLGHLALVYAGGALLLLALVGTLPARRRRWVPSTMAAGPVTRRRHLLGGGIWWVVAALPAVTGAVAAALLPVDRLLPIAIGGRLAVLLAVQGLVSALMLGIWRAATVPGGSIPDQPGPGTRTPGPPVGTLPAGTPPVRKRDGPSLFPGATFLGTAALLVIVLPAIAVTVGYPTQTHLLSVLPTGTRWWLLVVFVAAAVPFMTVDTVLVAHPDAPAGAAAVTTLGLFADWLTAIALNPSRLGFLVIVGPLLAAFVVSFGVLGMLAARRTGRPALGIGIRSCTFGWIVCVTFPLVV